MPITLFLIYRLPDATDENIRADVGNDTFKNNDTTENKRPSENVRTSADDKNKARTSLLLDPKYITLLFSFFLVGVAIKGFDNFYPVGLNDMKASDLLLGSTWIIEIIPEIILFYCLDKISAKIPIRAILITGTAAYALRMALLGCFPILWIWIVTQPISSLAFTFWYFGAVSIIRQTADERQQATAQTVFWSVSYGLGGVAGSFLSGYIADASGIPAFFRISSVLCIASMLILLILSKTRRNANTN